MLSHQVQERDDYMKSSFPPRHLVATGTGLGSAAPQELMLSQTSGTSKFFSIKQFQLLVIFTNDPPHKSINWS